ncbi:hypothetical protein [Duganella sp. HH101]|uniref:hypothetical protein n=1 Tax=Duganella sp. HH101 TaxID=1781066 RepID=UPI000893BC79|nr:hypothetical protein [Duganella sp. HH101]OFA02864.1 hypothetical protein DUGA2_31710 [Duganella sp. HH101]OFA03011.1 hypothetical protein DUGA2_33180 [Duganella sp. HH101]
MATPEQLAQVKENVSNLMDLTNHVHDYMQDVLSGVYQELSQDASPDPGQKELSTFFTAVFSCIGLLDFPGAGIFGTFLGTFFGAYSGPDEPPSLKSTFGSLWLRMNQTFLQANDDLSLIHADPAAYWNKSYINPLNQHSAPVSSLGDPKVTLPAKSDPKFQQITDAIINKSWYETTRTTIGQKFYIALVTTEPADPFLAGETDAQFAQFGADSIGKKTYSYFASRHAFTKNCCGDPLDGIQYSQFGLRTSNGWAAPDLCAWLFRDNQFGTVTNPLGIANRFEVFTQWEIPGSDLILNWPGSVWSEAPAALSPQDQEHAQAWNRLLEGTSRQELEKRLIRKFYADPAFAHALISEPEKAIAAELGVELPSLVKVEVLRETPGNYKLVIPTVGLAAYLAP